MDIVLNRVKILKKHVEQMVFLDPLQWNEISTKTIDKEEVETLKCIGFVNIKVKSNMKKFYLFSDDNGLVFRFQIIDWSTLENVKDENSNDAKYIYYKTRYIHQGSYENAKQFVINNNHIIQNKLVEKQLFI